MIIMGIKLLNFLYTTYTFWKLIKFWKLLLPKHVTNPTPVIVIIAYILSKAQPITLFSSIAYKMQYLRINSFKDSKETIWNKLVTAKALPNFSLIEILLIWFSKYLSSK